MSEDELDLRARRGISADACELWRAGMAARLARWPFEEVWADVCKTEKGAEDAQFSRLREAGIQLDVAGFDGLTRHPRASNCPGRAADQGAAAAAYKVMWSAVNGLTPRR